MSEVPPITTKDQFAWLDQIRDDAGLPSRAFSVGYTIMQHVNRRSGLAWPSQASLAKITQLTERTVGAMISALADAGHLELGNRRGTGGGFRRTYRMKLSARLKSEDFIRSVAPSKTEYFTVLPLPTKKENSRQQNRKNLPAPYEPLQNLESVTPDPKEGSALQARVPSTRTVLR